VILSLFFYGELLCVFLANFTQCKVCFFPISMLFKYNCLGSYGYFLKTLVLNAHAIDQNIEQPLQIIIFALFDFLKNGQICGTLLSNLSDGPLEPAVVASTAKLSSIPQGQLDYLFTPCTALKVFTQF